MSVDTLQEKIRKLKNPSMLQFSAKRELIPSAYLNTEASFLTACARYGSELLRGLKEIVPAVRFSIFSFSLLGCEGLDVLSDLTNLARQLGYYVVLDGPMSLTVEDAECTAQSLLNPQSKWPCDAVLISPYIGSDGIRPYLPYAKMSHKDIFVVVRTGNKSASEIQDLLTGSRLVHMAAADMVSRLGESYMGRCGYSFVGAVSCAGSPESLKVLRQQHPETFILIDGYDYSNANGKNCSYGFDQVGHGAVVCAGSSILAAWQRHGAEYLDPVEAAIEAAERMRKNILRYTTVF